MKHFLFFLVATIVWPFSVRAQMDEVYQDEQFSVSRIYAGMYSTTAFQTDSVATHAQVNLRFGIKSQLTLSEKVTFKTWMAIHLEKNQPVAGYNSLEMMFQPMSRLSFHLGLIATPTTVLRPNPTTWESQVETQAQSTIVPGRPGTKISYALSPKTSITYGYFNHGEHWGHHVNFSVNEWSLAGYRLDGGDHFIALKFKKKWLENIATFLSGQQVATSAFVNFENEVSLLVDAQFLLGQREWDYLRTGLRKYVQAPSAHLRGFFGLTYDWRAEVVIGQLFVSLY